MQVSVTSFSSFWSRVFFTGGLIAAALANTGCSGAQEVRHTGGMSQELNVGISDSLTNQIADLFRKILGREPTQDETASASSFLQANGNNLDVLRSSLANSDEARSLIQALLTESFGSQVNEATLELWLQALADNMSLAQIRALLNDV